MPTLIRTEVSQADHSSEVARWRSFAPTALTFIVFLISLRHTWLGMIQTWLSSRTFSHCFLILPLFVYLVWLRRKPLLALQPEPEYRGMAVFTILAPLWLIANLGDVLEAQEFLFVAMAVSLVLAMFGTGVVRLLKFPLAFLFFAVPFGTSLIGPLQDFTASFTVRALNLSNIPAVLQDNTLSVPSGAWTIAETCSGIRYLFASIVLGAVFASLAYRSRKRQLLLVLASLIVPIVANGLRAYLIVVVAYLTNNRLAAGVDHIVYGGLFFLAVETALLGFALRWREVAIHDWVEIPAPATATLYSAVIGMKAKMFLICLAAVIVSLLTPALATYLRDRTTKGTWDGPGITVAMPWRVASLHDPSWAPVVMSADRSWLQSFVSDQGPVVLRYGLFARRNVTVVNGYNLFANPKLWSSIAHRSRAASLEGQQISVDETVFSGPATRTVWTWYWLDGTDTGSVARLKWLQGKVRLRGKPTAGLAITVACDAAGGDSAVCSKLLADFVQHIDFSAPTHIQGP